MPRQIQFIVLAVLFVFAVSPAFGSQTSESPQAPGTGTIVGTVLDDVNGRAIRFANVVLLHTKLGGMTNQSGTYRIMNVPPGDYRIRAAYLGYAQIDTAVAVTAGAEVKVDFAIHSNIDPSGVYDIDGVACIRMMNEWVPLRDLCKVASPDVLAGRDAFAARLHQELASIGGNVVHSPLSVTAAFGLLLRGARGETAREIATMLHTDPDATDFLSALDTLRIFLQASTAAWGDQWSMANGAWFDNDVPLRPDFVDAVRSTPSDTVAAIDFSGAPDSSRDIINRWARDGTRGRIPEILPPGSVDASTVLILANAAYLRARWLYPFAEHRTADELFWVKGTDSTRVPTMRSTEEIPYGATADAQVIRLDYRGGNIGMVIVLPRTRAGLAELERRLDAPTIEEIRASLAPTSVELHLPRWRAASDWNMIPILQGMGISRAFRLGECELFGAIADPGMARQVCVSGAFHAATVDVYEQGTEASAATAHIATMSAMDWEEPVVLRVDHPFLWWIQENTTGTILFMGRVVDP